VKIAWTPARRRHKSSAEGTGCESPARQCRVECRRGIESRRDDTAHTYPNVLIHCVFSTKNRVPSIQNHQDEMWAYMGGIAKAHKIKPIIIGGMDDHAHLLLEMPTDIALADAMQYIKGSSSKWFSEKYNPDFEWQKGYAAFSVSKSLQKRAIQYISTQAIHHKKRDFKEELLILLKKHDVEYDPKYVFE